MKNKKAELGAINIAIFVVLGIIVIAIAVAMVNGITSRTSVSADTFTASNTSCVDITTNCILEKGTFVNATDGVTIAAANFTLCNYVGTYARGYYLNGSDATEAGFTGKTVNATYTEVGCGYVSNSMVQTLMPYVIILLAVLVFMVVAKWVQEQ